MSTSTIRSDAGGARSSRLRLKEGSGQLYPDLCRATVQYAARDRARAGRDRGDRFEGLTIARFTRLARTRLVGQGAGTCLPACHSSRTTQAGSVTGSRH